MNVTSILRRLRENALYHGWPAAVQVLAVALLRKFMRFEHVFLFVLDEVPPHLSVPPAERIHLASAEDVKRLAIDPMFDMTDLTPEHIDKLYASGDRCVFSMMEGRVTGYGWLTTGEARIPKLGIRFEVRGNEGYAYKGMTHPAFRGRQMGHDRLLFWLDYLRRNGRSTEVLHFAFENKATMSRVSKLNLKKAGTGTLIGFGRWKKLFLSGDFWNRKVFPL
ncbi:MAG: hypothetical protein V1798_04065 [Pseudomonadota bacterium]